MLANEPTKPGERGGRIASAAKDWRATPDAELCRCTTSKGGTPSAPVELAICAHGAGAHLSVARTGQRAPHACCAILLRGQRAKRSCLGVAQGLGFRDFTLW